jgi:hypothetical protein
MECRPAANDEVVKVACAPSEEAVLRVELPKTVLPSSNVTVPVGVPPPAPVTVAVIVPDWPGRAARAEEDSVVFVLSTPTVSVKAGPVLLAKIASPL